MATLIPLILVAKIQIIRTSLGVGRRARFLDFACGQLLKVSDTALEPLYAWLLGCVLGGVVSNMVNVIGRLRLLHSSYLNLKDK